MNQSTTIENLVKALIEAQKEIKPAIKDAENPFFKSKYADLGSTWNACRDSLFKNGLTVIQTVEIQADGSSVLCTTLAHTSGEWVKSFCPLLNNKGDMQGLGSAISYARRYGLAAICGIVTEDDDAEEASQPKRVDSNSPCTAAQAKMIQARLLAAGLRGADAANLLNKFGSHLPERIPFIKVNEVLGAIEASKKKSFKEPPDREEEIPFDPEIGWAKK